MVESFMRRSAIDGRSSEEIVPKEFFRSGAAYWALAIQMTMLSPTTSTQRLKTKGQRILSVLG
jgi:hypothetical protein